MNKIFSSGSNGKINLDDPALVQSIDSAGILSYLEHFDRQVKEALAIAEKVPPAEWQGGDFAPSQIIFSGMGGSAISGDLVRELVGPDLAVPFLVNRNHELPFVNSRSLVVLCSYSGNTAETLACLDRARAAEARIFCITSGGELLRASRRAGIPTAVIPGGYPPRCAVGFTCVILQTLLHGLGLAPALDGEAWQAWSRRQADELSPEQPSLRNRSKQLAEDLYGRVVIVYGSEGRTAAVARRWASQLAENGKQLAYFSAIPEMNHNEIVGWKHPRDRLEGLVAVFLRDKEDHPEVSRRIDFTGRLLGARAGRCLEISTEGSSWPERFWSLVLLGDFASVYAGILNSEDPTPVEVIEELKLSLREKESRHED